MGSKNKTVYNYEAVIDINRDSYLNTKKALDVLIKQATSLETKLHSKQVSEPSTDTHKKKNQALALTEQHVKSATERLKTFKRVYSDAFNSDQGVSDLQKLNKELKRNKISLDQLYNDYSRLGREGGKAGLFGQKQFRDLAVGIATAQKRTEKYETVLDGLKETMFNTIKWGISSRLMNQFSEVLSGAGAYIKNLDSALNNIRIVSGKTGEEMDRFAVKANRAAKALGSSTLAYTDAALIYYQQGLDTKQVEERTNTTIKMANVLGASAQEVSDYMTSIWNNFSDEGHTLEYYGDVLTALGAKTASSAEEISTGLEKFSAVAGTVGLSYEYASSALATVTATTRQSAEIVGTAFKTLFARIQGLSLGETLEDGTTLNKYSEALAKIGISIQKGNGQLKDMDTILDEMGSKWQTLEKSEKIALAQTVAGVRQYTQLIALMDNWDFFKSNVAAATSSEGSLNKQQEIYMESVAAHGEAARAAWDGFKQSLLDKDVLIFFADLSKSIGGLAKVLVEGVGSLNTFLAIGSVGVRALSSKISQQLITFKHNFQEEKDEDIARRESEDLIEQFSDIGKKYKSSPNELTQNEYDYFNDTVSKATSFSKAKDFLSDKQQYENNAILQKLSYAYDSKTDWDTTKEELKLYNDDIIKLKEERKRATALKKTMDEKIDNLSQHSELFEKADTTTLGYRLRKFFKYDKSTFYDRDNKKDYNGIVQGMIEKTVKDLQANPDHLKTLNYFDIGQMISESIGQALAESNRIERFVGNTETTKEHDDRINQGLKDAKEEADKAQRNADFAVNTNKMLQFAGSIGQVTSSFVGLSNAVQAFTNDNLEGMEKFQALIFGLGASSLNLLTGLSGMKTGLKDLLAIATKKSISKGLISKEAGSNVKSFTQLITALPGHFKLVAIAATAAAAIVGLAIKAMIQKAQEEKKEIENLRKASESLNKEYQSIVEDTSQLKGDFKKYKEVLTILDGCTKGTKEWADNLKIVNQNALEILKKYPILAEMEGAFVRTNGILRINEEVLDEYIKKKEEQASVLQSASIMADFSADKKEADAEKRDFLENKIRKYLERDGYMKTLNSTKTNFEKLNHSRMRGYNEILNPVGKIEQEGRQHVDTQMEVFKKNFNDLANLTSEEFKTKLRGLNFDKEFIDQVVKDQEALNKHAENTIKCSEKIHTAAEIIADIITKGKNNEDKNINTQKALSSTKYEKNAAETEDTLLDQFKHQVSKTSNAKNAIYQSILENLQKMPGYENLTAENTNPIIGGANNRKFAFMLDGERKEFTAEDLASKIAAFQTSESIKNQDFEKDADFYLEKIQKEYGIKDKKLADDLIGVITSKDYNNLTKEQIEQLKKIKEQGSLETDETKKEKNREDFKKAFGEDFDIEKGIEIAIDQWDPKKAEEKYKEKIDQLYKGVAQATGEEENTVRILAEGIKKKMTDFNGTEEDLIELTKQALIFQKHLKALDKTLEENKDILGSWKNSTKSAAELGYDTQIAVGQLKDKFEDTFGMEVNEDFLKENFDLIQAAVRGDLDAIDELEIAAGKDYILNLDIDGIDGIYKEYEDLFNTLGNTDLIMGATFNDEQALADLQNFFAKAQLGQKEAQAVLDRYGFKGELEEIKVPAQEVDASYTQPIITGYKVNQGPDEWYPNRTTGERDPITGPSFVTPEMGQEKIPVKKTVSEGYSYFVLKSKDGPSTPKSIKTTGLVGSVTSKGTGFIRKMAASGYGGSRRSKGSSSKPRKEKKLTDNKDRYHDVNIELSQIATNLKVAQEKIDRISGEEKIANLTEQFHLLNKQIATTGKKIEIAKGEMSELQDKLKSYGTTFNSDGTISNYTAAYLAQLQKVNSVIDHYNSLSKDGQEKYQETLDKAKEDFKTFTDSIGKYDKLLTDTIPDLQANIQDAINKQIELKVKAFHSEIELRLEMADAERDWNEFYRKIIKDIDESDIFGNAKEKLKDFMSYYKEDSKGVIQTNTKHVLDIIQQLEQMKNGTASIYGEDGTNNYTLALEELKKYYDQLKTDLTEVHDLTDEIRESYLQTLDEIQEKFDEQINSYQKVNDLIEHDKNIVSMLYGEDSYSELSKFYEKQEENNNKQLDFQKQQVLFWKNEMDSAEKGSEAWEKARDQWMSAVDAWNSKVQESIENLKDKFLNSLNEIFQTLNNEVTNGMGLDFVESEWDLINKNANEYLDTVNAVHKVQQLQNKYLEAIEKTDNPAQQKRLNDLMQQETKYLKEQDKLSQYDIDRANLKYELALKQIALEEAQRNKTTLRLRRDSQGNYTYQYTADQDKVGQVQQEISDLYNQLYNLDTDKYKDNLGKLQSIWVEFQEAMKEAAQINDPEQRAQKELLIKQQYGELINGIVGENEDIQSNLYNSTMSHLFDLYDQNADNFEMMTDKQKEILNNFMNAQTDFTGAAFDNIFGIYNQNIEQFHNMSEQQKDILMSETLPQWDSALQEMADKINGEGGFGPVCQDAFDKIDSITNQYNKDLDELSQSAGVNFDEIKNGINNTLEETKKLIGENDQLIDGYTKEVDAIKGVISELDALVKKYEEASEAAKKATEDAYHYWQEEQKQNANEFGEGADIKTEADNLTKNEPQVENITPTEKAPTSGGDGVLSVGDFVTFTGGKFYTSAYGGQYGTRGSGKQVKVTRISNGAPYPIHVYSEDSAYGWLRKDQLSGYDTGGYTGEWDSSGRLALLHQKELVLNQRDTVNMLNAVSILRNLTDSLGNSLFSKIAGITANGDNIIGKNINDSNSENQNVVINANFPNVEKANEIEEALNNLVNKTSQYIQEVR